jgi:hypothetical protein
VRETEGQKRYAFDSRTKEEFNVRAFCKNSLTSLRSPSLVVGNKGISQHFRLTERVTSWSNT